MTRRRMGAGRVVRPVVGLAALFASVLPARAATPAIGRVLSHEGRLLDASDQPVSGTKTLKFRLFAAAQPEAQNGSTALWTSELLVNVAGGNYSVMLGDADHGGVAFPDDVFLGDRWLSVTIDGTELLPRLRVGAVPLAVTAETALVAKNLACEGGACVESAEIKSLDGAKVEPASLAWTALKPLTASTTIANLDAATVGGKLADDFAPKSHTHKASELTDGAATFAAKSHTHALAEITDAAATLATFAPKSHTHAASEITGTLAMSQLPQADLTALVNGQLAQVSNGTLPLRPQVVSAVDCSGNKSGQLFFDSTRSLLVQCQGTTAKIVAGTLPTGCRELLQAAPATPSGIYTLSPSGDPSQAVDVYCDMTTTRNGTLGWGLLSVVTSDAGSFWTGFTPQQSIINTSKGAANPASANYLLAITHWQRFMQGGRTLVAEITRTSGSYSNIYQGFRLDQGFRYTHVPGAVWQHNDPNNGVTYTGDLYPYPGGYANNCAAASGGGLGWWGACGYSHFYQLYNGSMTHPVDANGNYALVTGVTRKAYWFQ